MPRAMFASRSEAACSRTSITNKTPNIPKPYVAPVPAGPGSLTACARNRQLHDGLPLPRLRKKEPVPVQLLPRHLQNHMYRQLGFWRCVCVCNWGRGGSGVTL